jgi:hypothetical protein
MLNVSNDQTPFVVNYLSQLCLNMHISRHIFRCRYICI